LKLNKKILGIVVAIIVVCSLVAVSAVYLAVPNQSALTPTGELDFSVSEASDCLRFLNSSVATIYVPFTVAANQNWQLTVNATKMPGGANGWTDVYIYKGYWDKGANYTCKSGDIYPILNKIESANFAIKTNMPYVENFGGQTQESYTVFFVIPPGGQTTFHVTFKPV
jgi:hypothetical protein